MIKHFFDIVTNVVKPLRVKLHKFLSVAFYYHGLYNYGTILNNSSTAHSRRKSTLEGK